MPPSPTAAAQRLTEPERTSPAAKIPGRLVSDLVNGKFLNLSLEQAYLEGENIRIPAVVRILDPLSRIKNVRVDAFGVGGGKIGTAPLTLDVQ